MPPPLHVGIDFGTTNSALAYVLASGETEVAQFAHAAGMTEVFRSLLYFERHRDSGMPRTIGWTGPVAIDHYLAAETKGRLVQSLKSFLSDRTLDATDIFGRRQTLEALMARILRDLREQTEAHLQQPIRAAVVGRPVRFVGANTEADDAFAERRLAEALALGGFEHVRFEFEPVAAAHFYEASLDHDELILIGDFGGGTSDFSLARVGPTFRDGGRPDRLLGNAGLGLAGDAFDARIVRHLVSPALGAGSQMRSLDKVLPVPIAWYSRLERWHHLSMLNNRATLGQLERVRAQAEEPAKIEALIHLIANDLGYQLHRAVQLLKYELSRHSHARFRFRDGSVVDLDVEVSRAEFEAWIAPELHAIAHCIDQLLASAGVTGGDVDRVFLTGGTSLVPAVRRIFETRFGPEALRAGNEFTSVARGLALKALALSNGVTDSR